jgi:yecA family protein
VPRAAKPKQNKDKSVFDVRISEGKTEWLTLSVSADCTLADLHLSILGAVQQTDALLEVESIYRFTIGSAVYANGRGSRTPLRRILQASLAFVYECDPIGVKLACDVAKMYEVPSRRHHPKVVAGSFHDDFDMKRATWSAQSAMNRDFRYAYVYDREPTPTPTPMPSDVFVHGYVTAIAIGPRVMPSAWIGRFMGTVFEIESARAMLDGVMQTYNNVLRATGADPAGFREHVAALCLRDTTGDALCDWVTGFFEAMAVCGDEWLALAKNKEFRKAFEPLAAAFEFSKNPKQRLWLNDRELRTGLAQSLGAGALWVSEFFSDPL